ncbi:MAG: Lipopolysaccharide assembly protein B [Prosthecobacter sp.]|nr:Lipopolysaccharide assembly protein B [Prosthecobacter sp.]
MAFRILLLRRTALRAVAAGIGLMGLMPCGAEAQGQARTGALPWAERETRLANEYLSLLVGQPEYGRVVDLLWALYEKHEATALLMESVTAQVQAQRHPSVVLVLGHLLRKSGDLKKAAATYEQVLGNDSYKALALQSLADVAQELGDPAKAQQWTGRLNELLPDTDPQKVDVLLRLGTLALSAQKNEEAVKAWEQAAKLKPADFQLVRQVAELILRAGFPERAAAFYTTLADQGDPQKRLDALYDLARIHEHADQFEKADAALKKGLALLDFRDVRYTDFFRRRVRLHERFGTLEDLRQLLVKAAAARPPDEQALRDLARFEEMTADSDAHVKTMRELVKVAPQVDDYRWELVRLLLDHDGTAEAAKLLDERLRGDGGDLPVIVFLRCEADLRSGRQKEAVERLRRLLESGGGNAEVEKQALAFAQQRALDEIVEAILKARVGRDPGRAEAVFELAAFHRARKDMAAADALLRRFTRDAPNEQERQRRLNEAAGFMATGSDLDTAIILAREAVAKPGAGREEFLRLADLLTEHAEPEEALEWLEKAWKASKNEEEGVDVDERIYSLLLGERKKEAPRQRGTGGDFQLPEIFTGKGFAMTEEKPAGAAETAEEVLNQAGRLVKSAAVETQPLVLYRAAWWALRAEQWEEAYAVMRRLEAVSPGRSLPPEAEKLLLELTLADKNTALAMRVLRRLIAKDPANVIRYTLRLSELLLEDEQTASAAVNVGLSHERTGWRMATESPPPGRAATLLLERAYRESPDSEQLLNALTQCYALQRRADDALKLWQQAIGRSTGGAASALMQRYAEMLLQRGMLPGHVDVQLRIVEQETDVKRRREAFTRFLDRFLWAGEGGGELPEEVMKERLELIRDSLLALVKKHPFDGFYHEALAHVHERSGDVAKAFAAMKQAYYTAPDTPFSLDQLREAALKVNDLKSAIYFQKQVAAGAAPGQVAAESRRLVEMLEQTFQIAEADRVRRRLESRFSQDAAALEDLAEHYRSTGQDEAERRVYEQISRVRPWDAKSELRLALKCLRLADEEGARKHLAEILRRTQAKAFMPPEEGAPERLPLPLAEQRKAGPPGPVTEVLGELDAVPALKTAEVAVLRSFLSLPRPEFSELPDEVPHLRLRAVEELARLNQKSGTTQAWKQETETWKSPVERLWALYFARLGGPFRSLLEQVMNPAEKASESLEAVFCRTWLTIRSGGMAEAMDRATQTGLDGGLLEQRQRMVLAVCGVLADLDGFRFAKGGLARLGTLRSVSVLDILRRLQDQQRYAEALELGESLSEHNPALGSAFVFSLARIAESAERWDVAREYLGRVVRGAVQPEAYRGTYDPYLFSLSAANRLAVSAAEREQNVRSAWRRLQAVPPSSMTTLRKAAVAGLAGAPDKAAAEMEALLTGGFLPARQMGEPKGMLMPQGSPRWEEPMHLRSLWEETREIEARFTNEGLGQVVQQVNERLSARWGGVALSSRSGLEFGEWRLGHLIRRMRTADYPTRVRLLREHLASVDMRQEVSVDTLSELGGRLEAAGMSREAIEVYGMLPGRAPANPEYAQWLIRVSEAALDTRTGLKFTLQLLEAEPPYKPPQPGDEVLREKHSHFLALEHDVNELHRRGYLPAPTRVLQGRIPHEVPYLRELALLYERTGQDRLALDAWNRLHEAFVANEESGVIPDAESSVHRAQLLVRQKQPAAALEALRSVPLVEKSGAQGREALKLRAELAAEAGRWEEFREMMTVAVDLKAIDAITHLTALCRRHSRAAEGLNFLTQAERTMKEDAERFRLRLELLRLLAADAGWSPDRGRAQVASFFRVRHRGREALNQLSDWMNTEAAGKNRAAWLTILRAETRAGTDRPLAALALSAFADKAPGSLADDLAVGWQNLADGDRICVELAAENLLKKKRPDLAWKACQVMQELPSMRLESRKQPLMLRVAHAMKDRTIVQELFAEVVRMPMPGGSQTAAWAQALQDCGELQMARELYQTALQRLEATQATQPDIVIAWARFLISQKEHEAAETLLVRDLWQLPNEAAGLLFELYQSWGRLADIQQELRKFHLTGGIEKEVLYLASKALGLPPPVAAP